MDAAPLNAWRDVFEKNYSALVDEVSSRLDSELRSATTVVADAERANAVRQIEAARRTTAETLNQALRRIRQSASEGEVLQLLADATAPWADRLVVVSVESSQEPMARAVAARGVEAGGLSIALESAGALRAVVDSKGPDSKEPVVALISEKELSAELAAAMGGGGAGATRAYLFPVVARQTVVAMAIAAGEVAPAPLELLSEAAGMKVELLTTPAPLAPLKPADFVQIVPVAAAARAVTEADGDPKPALAPKRWEELSAEDQRLHLQAQRVARVKVAELRLYNTEELRKGVFAGDIYSALRNGIDEARTEFLRDFLSKSPTMVDYLHLEILRSLAHEDDRLLGKDYPGPMV